MQHWDLRLVRLFRALIACTVLLFAAHAPLAAVEPVRDVSAWLAASRVRVVAPAPAAPRSSASSSRASVSRASASSAQRAWVPFRSEPGGVLAAPSAARAAHDERYLYLDLQTLRC
jgi:hypothetical protein